MTKFQKKAIVLGVVYLAYLLIYEFIYSWLGVEYGDTTCEVIRFLLRITAVVCIPLLLLFNALHHKSSLSRTAAILGGVWLALAICANILNIMGLYSYHYDDYGGHLFYEISGIIGFVMVVVQIIAIGFFAESHRKNTFVLIASILYIIVQAYQDYLAHDFFYSWIMERNGFSHDYFDYVWIYINYVPCVLSACLLFASAATVKGEE